MAMKANQIQSHGGTEVLKLIAASNGVRKLGRKEGRTKQVGDVRLTWKATGEDTGYATSFYEMDLPPGKGIPLHSHPSRPSIRLRSRTNNGRFRYRLEM